jgi:hypothetical protein
VLGRLLAEVDHDDLVGQLPGGAGHPQAAIPRAPAAEGALGQLVYQALQGVRGGRVTQVQAAPAQRNAVPAGGDASRLVVEEQDPARRVEQCDGVAGKLQRGDGGAGGAFGLCQAPGDADDRLQVGHELLHASDLGCAELRTRRPTEDA